ncbi:DUF1833 family protein [Rhodopseudomonas sp. BR0C11]|uniref:DUF1833 family protein n=1 Tax=Rhodopseudomonas sp. BR0C11 TaxID=2269370 RepID=UPI001FEE1386|nr:DUF1833 family protein [Rhodopseudomonas sp. BR0C11]
MPSYSEAWLEAVASCPPSERTYDTVQLDHPSFGEPAYIVANVADDMQFGIEPGAAINAGQMVTFIACPFKAPWPEQREGQPPVAKVEIDNVARELVPKVRAALGYRSYITVTHRQYLESDRGEPAYGPISFILSNVTLIGTKLSGEVRVKNLQNKRFPKLDKNYSYTDFPSLLP